MYIVNIITKFISNFNILDINEQWIKRSTDGRQRLENFLRGIGLLVRVTISASTVLTIGLIRCYTELNRNGQKF